MHTGAPRCHRTWLAWSVPWGIAAVCLAQCWAMQGADAAEGDELASRIEQLVPQLGGEDAAAQDRAEKELIDLGVAAGEQGWTAFSRLLPQSQRRAPKELQARLARIRREVQHALARKAVVESRVTVEVKNAPLVQVLELLEKQSGNKIVDYREQLGQEPTGKLVTLTAKDAPFWPTFDQVLDAANMSPYEYAGKEALGIVERDSDELRRFGRAVYTGPFRIEATAVQAQRGLRSPTESGLQVDLEISWEPRVNPLVLVQPAADLVATLGDGLTLPTLARNTVFDVDVPPGSYTAEASVSLQLPGRQTKTIKKLAGTLTALVPGRMVDMEFDNLAAAEDASQEAGGVQVTLERVVKSEAVWEVHMRIRVGPDVESHRGWVLQNEAYLRNQEGEKFESVGIETTMQDEHEAGFAYIFEVPDDISNYVWVYRTPTALVYFPVEYALDDIPLP